MATNGNDTIIFSGTLQQFTATLTNAYSGYTLSIDEEKNVNNAIYDGLNGTDTLIMSSLGDVLLIDNGSGTQMIRNVESIIASAGGDVINLASTTYIITTNMNINGGAGDDILWANSGNDTIRGLDGNDIIDGGPGFDNIDGGTGNDYLSGGTGFDTYTFSDNTFFGNDVISEGADAETNNILFTPFSDINDLTFTISGFDLIIDVNNGAFGGSITILGQFSAPGAGIDNIFFASNGTTFDLRSITKPNEAPVAGDDAFSGDEDNTITGNVLTNDTDSYGGAISAVAGTIATAAGGTVVLGADGKFTYTPAADFHGDDSFDYEVIDGQGGSDFGTVSLTVASVNDAPIAGDDAFAGDEDTIITGNVLGNDSDIDGDTIYVWPQTIATAAGGTVEILSNGDFIYTPVADFFGADSFDYYLKDGSGGMDIGTVNLTIAPVNDAPVAGDDDFAGDEDTVISGNVLGNDTDIDGSLSAVAATITTAAGGTVVLGADGNFTYTPLANFFGADSFDYEVIDGQGGSDTATVNLIINDVIDAPADLEVYGTAGANLLQGGDGNDTIYYNADAVWSSKYAAKNVGSILDPGTGKLVKLSGYNRSYDQFEGGAGIDTIIMTSGNDAIFIDDMFSPRPAATSGSRVGDIEIIRAGDGNDVVDLTSDQWDYNSITIYGDAGNDSLWSSAGDDVIYGGSGNDDIYGGYGIDSLYGDEGNDTIRGSDGDDFLSGGNDNDTLYGGNDNDIVMGDAGNDTLYGDAGDDDLDGGAGNDKIYGGNDNDIVRGGAGNDTLYGDAGDDILAGGEGVDTLYGGSGADTFVFDSLVGKDTVKDFQKGQDRLDISDILDGYDASDNLADFVKFTISGSNTDIKVNVDGLGSDFVTIATIAGVKITDSVDTLAGNGTLLVL